MIDDAQFIISQERYEKEGFLSLPLKGEKVLSYQRKLRVYYEEGNDVLLLGYAWQTDPTRQSPEKEIESTALGGALTEALLMTMEETWCGRYVLIHNGNVYLDASSMLSVFYSDYGISSSVAILARAMGLREHLWHPDKNLLATNYLIGTHTQYPEIKKLAPSQVYNYYIGSVHGRQLLPLASERFASEQFASDDERIKRFVKLFAHSLTNMARLFQDKKLLVALTGGYDSRVLFALMHYAKIEFDCFTLQHDRICSGDVSIPKLLCEAVGCNHIYIERDKENFSQERLHDYEKHTAGLANDEDKQFHAYRQYQQLRERYGGECVLLRGLLWETAAEYYGKNISDTATIEEICSVNYYIKKDSETQRSLDEYIRWTEECKQEGLSASTRLYWEQRAGNWVASTEQSFDMMDGIISLQPVNSRILLDLLLGFNKEERARKAHQQRITAFACPEIASVPYAAPDLAGRWGRLRDIVSKGKRFVAHAQVVGIKDTIKVYKGIVKAKLSKKKG